jgi:hypothetical protein
VQFPILLDISILFTIELHLSIEADDALNSMKEDLAKGDLVAAHINRWVANQWLKASE